MESSGTEAGKRPSSTASRLRARQRGQCRGARAGTRGAMIRPQRAHLNAAPHRYVLPAECSPAVTCVPVVVTISTFARRLLCCRAPRRSGALRDCDPSARETQPCGALPRFAGVPRTQPLAAAIPRLWQRLRSASTGQHLTGEHPARQRPVMALRLRLSRRRDTGHRDATSLTSTHAVEGGTLSPRPTATPESPRVRPRGRDHGEGRVSLGILLGLRSGGRKTDRPPTEDATELRADS